MDELALERRLLSIEHKIDTLDSKVETWGQAQVEQNGKVKRLTEWKETISIQNAENRGFNAGAQSIQKKHLAVFGIATTFIQLLIAAVALYVGSQ